MFMSIENMKNLEKLSIVSYIKRKLMIPFFNLDTLFLVEAPSDFSKGELRSCFQKWYHLFSRFEFETKNQKSIVFLIYSCYTIIRFFKKG